MPFELPKNPSDPDGAREHDFVFLVDVAPEIATVLIDRYLKQWLALAELRPEDPMEAVLTVELRVAYFGVDGVDTELRMRSWYTGSTYWHPEWDETLEDAISWIDAVAELQAGNALGDLQYGPRLWEDKPRHRRKRGNA